VGLEHCNKFLYWIYDNRTGQPATDPTYAAFLRTKCDVGRPDGWMELMDQATPALFDNQYHRNACRTAHGGAACWPPTRCCTPRTGRTAAFYQAFAGTVVRLGGVVVKSGAEEGNIRKQCDVFSS
jgi:hypothetical protein